MGLERFVKSSKNLLPNGGFDVWQRGESFSSATSGVSAYTADGWMATGTSGTANWSVSKIPGGLRVVNSDSLNYLDVGCFSEIDLDKYPDRIFTRSMSFKNLTGNAVVYNSFLLNEVWTPWAWQPVITKKPYMTIEFPSGVITYLRTIVRIEPSSSADIEYAKLEPGRVATPHFPEDPAIALARCQRYLHVIERLDGNPVIGAGFFYGAYSGVAKIDIPPHMRKISPTVTFPSVENLEICAEGYRVRLTAIEYNGESTNASFNARFDIPSTYNFLNKPCTLQMYPGASGEKIIVSKEF
jgi:hypothetical protein